MDDKKQALAARFKWAIAALACIIVGSPDLIDMLGQAPVSAERRALQQIREAGYNDHPTSVWMQKVAAHALYPEKFPHPGEQPKA